MTSKLSNFHACLVQIVHKGHSPQCELPGFRILRFVNNEETVPKAVEYLQSVLPGATIEVMRAGEFAAITESPQGDAYKKAVIQRVLGDSDARASFLKDDYRREYQVRMDEDADIGEAVDDLNAFIAEWNERPWVKAYKKIHGYRLRYPLNNQLIHRSLPHKVQNKHVVLS